MEKEVHDYCINNYDHIGTCNEAHIIRSINANNVHAYITVCRDINGQTWGIGSKGSIGTACSYNGGTTYVHNEKDLKNLFYDTIDKIEDFLLRYNITDFTWHEDWKDFSWDISHRRIRKFKRNEEI